MTRVFVLSLLVTSLACDDPRPRPTDYDQSCTTDAECVPVYSGCGGCDCTPAGAVNKRDEERFNRDVERAECAPRLYDEGCSCVDADGVCKNGKCEAQVDDVE